MVAMVITAVLAYMQYADHLLWILGKASMIVSDCSCQIGSLPLSTDVN